ncbi:Calcium permeable stress-gated cation channel 1 [Daldinia childiae]|uniref:Calcium permeable stress-gated cation channel 1 n=1 Tax=Daldinia childiae TaxID=326645 RepID=UPI0014451BAB|nr:Calcium permeable stress-gated cation channel 1 [Daldinia childiae]KAF3060905.1 Calcium permeable stress-gated cation channel 1 [Daldinia childiae]
MDNGDGDGQSRFCHDGKDGEKAAGPDSKDIYVQLVISLALGISAFVAFCILRPRWKTLYAARRRHYDPQIALPALPDSFFGWIPALYRITEEQVLASAGLDAFVFLSFFKMSLRLFTTMLFFALAVLWPIHKTFNAGTNQPPSESFGDASMFMNLVLRDGNYSMSGMENILTKPEPEDKSWSLLWAPVFTWLFSFLTMYFMNSETIKVIKVRQDYLGTQSTITDRTFRLTGVPEDIRSEEKVKEFVENLEIGHVRSVALCRNWSEIDGLMAERQILLRKLEEAWSVYLARRPPTGASNHQQRPDPDRTSQGNDDNDEESQENRRLLTGDGLRDLIAERARPKVRLRYGFLRMRSRKTDALDYYEEKLRRLDEKIRNARRKEYTPTDTAFVTMDSIAACQMAMQATIDPRPGQLLSKPAPAPSDVIWKNTYTPRYKRRLKAWTVTLFITFLSIIWLFPVAVLAQLLSLCGISKVAPSLAETLYAHDITRAFVRTGLPTLVVSLLNVLVPYLYDYLSNKQGMMSQGDVELSTISKNFFFIFFNIFVVYAVSGSAALSDFWKIIGDSLSDTRTIAKKLAISIQNLNNFYLNFIMLQGFGLFPFKLLQFGGITLYAIYRMGAKTPRDFAELVRPSLFNYGFYLPTALLVFILCLVYSILPGAHIVLLLGVCYFSLGYFVYKYQLLYSMDQPQHATGGAWPIICGRIIVGLVAFEVIMIAFLVLQTAFIAASFIAPLVVLTFWYSFYSRQRYTPLTKFIALRSIKRATDPGSETRPDRDPDQVQRQTRLTRRMSTIDEDKEKGMRFINPSLVVPLEQPWVYQDPPPLLPESSVSSSTGSVGENGSRREASLRSNDELGSVSSSFSLGDTHIWRDSNGDDNV